MYEKNVKSTFFVDYLQRQKRTLPHVTEFFDLIQFLGSKRADRAASKMIFLARIAAS